MGCISLGNYLNTWAGGRVVEGKGLQIPRGNSNAGSNPVSPSGEIIWKTLFLFLEVT